VRALAAQVKARLAEAVEPKRQDKPHHKKSSARGSV